MARIQLTWGSDRTEPSQCRVFGGDEHNDATTRFAERVVDLDADPAVSAGWVHLKRLADGKAPEVFMGAWTKTSDERPTAEGEVAEPV